MTAAHRVVHVAASRGQAHTLKNLLLEYGIEAYVDNDLAGDLYISDVSSHRDAPRVVVPERDYDRACEILEESAMAIEQGAPSPELARLEADADQVTAWPVCPHCTRPRLTSCPVCETSGTNFAEAFMPDLQAGDREPDEGEHHSLMVLCPTCDEPFVAQFPARCEWCGHRFGDGYEPPSAQAVAIPQFSSLEIGGRAVIVALGLLAFTVALFGWFYYVLH